MEILIRSRARLFFLSAALALLFAPTLFWLGDAWLSDPYYSHGPLVLVGALGLAWMQRRAASTIPRVPQVWGLGFVLLAIVVHLLALPWRAFWISALMLPLAIAGSLITLYGIDLARKFWFPLVFLIFMVPLPLAERVGPPLEAFAASGSTWVVNLFGVHATNVGSQIFLPATSSQFTVGIPCGGLRSLIALVTLIAALAYVVQGSPLARLLLLMLAVPIALAANIVRLVILFGIANQWGAAAGLDYFHGWASPVLFLVAFALVLLAARALKCDQPAWDLLRL